MVLPMPPASPAGRTPISVQRFPWDCLPNPAQNASQTAGSRMIVFCVIEPSLQRVRRSLSCGAYKGSYVIHGRRIGTSSLRKGAFLHAPPVQEPR
jgi:hypothetical protein